MEIIKLSSLSAITPIISERINNIINPSKENKDDDKKISNCKLGGEHFPMTETKAQSYVVNNYWVED